MLQNASGHFAPVTKGVRSAIGQRHLVSAVIGAGFLAISIGSFDADLGTGYPTAYAVSSHAAPARHRPPSDSIDPPKAKRPTENELSDFSRLWHDGCGKTIIEAQNVD
jgi:hypothetical protein